MKHFLQSINRDIFTVSMVTLFVYFIFEIKIPGIVSNYVHFGYLITLVFVTGFVYAWQPPKRSAAKRVLKMERILSFVVAVLAAWCMFLLARPLGWGAYVLALLLFIIMLLVRTPHNDTV